MITWGSSFFAGLLDKFVAMPFQLDFGNFAVGLGTAFVAIASFQAIRRSGRQRIGEFRKEWIEDLRVHLAEILALNASQLQMQRESDGVLALNPDAILYAKEEEMKKASERKFYLISYVQLMLNKAEEAHRELEKIMFEVLQSGPTGESLNRFVTQSRLVLKTEWDRVKI
jgi:hypothetical protein